MCYHGYMIEKVRFYGNMIEKVHFYGYMCDKVCNLVTCVTKCVTLAKCDRR